MRKIGVVTEDKKMLGPTGEQVQANVQRLREARGMTKKQLADRVTELGRAMAPLAVSRIEAGTRRVDIDDLAAIAIALRVSPITLMLPWAERADETAEVTGAGSVPTGAAWLWAEGIRPLILSKADPIADMQRYILDSLPVWARDAARLAWRDGQVGFGEWDQSTGLHEWYERISTGGKERDGG